MGKDKSHSSVSENLFKVVLEEILEDFNLLTAETSEKVDLIWSKILNAVTPLLLSEIHPQIEEETPGWMMGLANSAVEVNLKEDGSNKYQAAQGYACALSAIKLLNSYNPKTEEPKKDASVEKKTPEQKESILTHAREIYDHVKLKFGNEAAAKQAVVYIAEQYGIVDWNDLGIVPNEKEELLNMVISKFEE